MKIKRYSDKNGFDAESKFLEDYRFAYSLLKYVESISGENRWFVDECFENDSGEYWVIFKSYMTPEYKNFLLSIRVTRSGSGWEFYVHKQVTELS